jgi:hypothetical protein
MRRLAYFLILLLLSAQVDDAFAVAPVLPSAPVAGDDDGEYLPSKPRRLEQESLPDKEPAFDGLKAETADFPLVRRGVPSERNLTTPFTPAPLYVFMSLRL